MASETSVDYNRDKELKDFDETKSGVKGLVDSGIARIPRMFIRPADELAEELVNPCQTDAEVPIIDLTNNQEANQRKKIVDEVRAAAAEWGFFQVINHGIPLSVLDQMIDGVEKFHEQDLEVKKGFYSRDTTKKVRFQSNFDLYTARTADWRDTLTLFAISSDPDPKEMPAVCRESSIEYTKHIRVLGENLFELLSEALGLQAEHLSSIGCAKGCSIHCHYYPACPQPDLTLGIRKHTDPGFLTLLLQNEISGLQILHEGKWFDVHPTPGAIVVNIGDLLQIVSNDKFKSVRHRALATRIGPRISVPCVFSGHASLLDNTFSPINELTSEADPPRFKDVLLREYLAKFLSLSLDKPLIDYYKI